PRGGRASHKQGDGLSRIAHAEARSKAHDLCLTPALAGNVDEFSRSVEQGNSGTSMPIFAPEFGGAAQEEGQQRPISTGVELAQRVFHAVKGDGLRPRTKLCRAVKNRALPIALECFIRTTNSKTSLKKYGK